MFKPTETHATAASIWLVDTVSQHFMRMPKTEAMDPTRDLPALDGEWIAYSHLEVRPTRHGNRLLLTLVDPDPYGEIHISSGVLTSGLLRQGR